jgi:hypothetical protein
MKKNDQAAAAATDIPENSAAKPARTEVREIPGPPGGGSWTWDEPSWSWISNDPVVETEVNTPE